MVTCAILSVLKSQSIKRGVGAISTWDLWGQRHEGTDDTERRALGANPVVSGRTATASLRINSGVISNF